MEAPGGCHTEMYYPYAPPVLCEPHAVRPTSLSAFLADLAPLPLLGPSTLVSMLLKPSIAAVALASSAGGQRQAQEKGRTF